MTNWGHGDFFEALVLSSWRLRQVSVLQILNWKGFHAYDYIVTTLTLVKLGAFIHCYKRKTWLIQGGRNWKEWSELKMWYSMKLPDFKCLEMKRNISSGHNLDIAQSRKNTRFVGFIFLFFVTVKWKVLSGIISFLELFFFFVFPFSLGNFSGFSQLSIYMPPWVKKLGLHLWNFCRN